MEAVLTFNFYALRALYLHHMLVIIEQKEIIWDFDVGKKIYHVFKF